MNRVVKVASLLFCGVVAGCSCIKLPPPNVGPPAVSRVDVYDYSFGGFVADAGDPKIRFGDVNPIENVPIVWYRNVEIDVTSETKDSIAKLFGPPDGSNFLGLETVYYKSNDHREIAIMIHYNKDTSIHHVTLGPEAGVSLRRDSEVLTIPFSRDDLIRVFGQPNKYIKSN